MILQAQGKNQLMGRGLNVVLTTQMVVTSPLVTTINSLGRNMMHTD